MIDGTVRRDVGGALMAGELERWDPDNVVVIQHQIDTVLEHRLAGRSIRTIAELMGISRSTVQRRQDAGIAQLPVQNAEQLRKVELARLDSYLAALDDRVRAGDPASVQAALRVSDRRAKLLGLDAPVELHATVTELTEAEAELQQMLREARVAVAMEEDALRREDRG